MSFFNSMNISASGLTAQRLRMDVISQNIANVNTTRTAEGTPYRRQTVIIEERNDAGRFSGTAKNHAATGNGVRVTGVVQDNTPGAMRFEPSHPDADENGYVVMPNVNIVEEMVNMISASRSYEANITAMNITKTMIAKTLEIGR
jgi:flagellar basal-body rod protein FlgC